MKYEQPADKSLHPGPKDVDESKVVQALEELLEAPLISGFVSLEQVSLQKTIHKRLFHRLPHACLCFPKDIVSFKRFTYNHG